MLSTAGTTEKNSVKTTKHTNLIKFFGRNVCQFAFAGCDMVGFKGSGAKKVENHWLSIINMNVQSVVKKILVLVLWN